MPETAVAADLLPISAQSTRRPPTNVLIFTCSLTQMSFVGFNAEIVGPTPKLRRVRSLQLTTAPAAMAEPRAPGMYL